MTTFGPVEVCRNSTLHPKGMRILGSPDFIETHHVMTEPIDQLNTTLLIGGEAIFDSISRRWH